MSKDKLTPLQSKFIDYYLTTWNGVKSAKLAGYRGDYNTLGVVAHENLKKPKIREAIEARLAEHAMGANEALARLAEIARADMGDFSDVKTFDNLEDHPQSWLVKEIQADVTPGPNRTIKNVRFKLKLHDSLRALEMIGKNHRLFSDHIVIEDDSLTDEDRANRIIAILDAARARRDK